MLQCLIWRSSCLFFIALFMLSSNITTNDSSFIFVVSCLLINVATPNLAMYAVLSLPQVNVFACSESESIWKVSTYRVQNPQHFSSHNTSLWKTWRNTWLHNMIQSNITRQWSSRSWCSRCKHVRLHWCHTFSNTDVASVLFRIHMGLQWFNSHCPELNVFFGTS